MLTDILKYIYYIEKILEHILKYKLGVKMHKKSSLDSTLRLSKLNINESNNEIPSPIMSPNTRRKISFNVYTGAV